MESDGLVRTCPCSSLLVIIVNFYIADIAFCNTSNSYSFVRTIPSLSFAKNAEGWCFFSVCVLSFRKYELLAHSSVSSDWSGHGHRGLVPEQLTWLEKLAGNLAGLPTGANRWFDPSPHLAVFSFHFLFSPSLCGGEGLDCDGVFCIRLLSLQPRLRPHPPARPNIQTSAFH